MTASENPCLTPHQDPGFYQGGSLGEPVALIEFCQHPEVSNGVIGLRGCRPEQRFSLHPRTDVSSIAEWMIRSG